MKRLQKLPCGGRGGDPFRDCTGEMSGGGHGGGPVPGAIFVFT